MGIRLQDLAIYEEFIQTNEKNEVVCVEGFIGPSDETYTKKMRDDQGRPTGVSRVENIRQADYKLEFKNGQLTKWSLLIHNTGLYTNTKEAGLAGDSADGVLQISQIVNAFLNAAAEYANEL